MSASLAERDVDGVLSVLGLAASIDGSRPFELPVIERLVELIPADGAGYWEYEHCRAGGNAYFVRLGPTTPAHGSPAWRRRPTVSRLLATRDDRLRPLGTAMFFSDSSRAERSGLTPGTSR